MQLVDHLISKKSHILCKIFKSLRALAAHKFLDFIFYCSCLAHLIQAQRCPGSSLNTTSALRVFAQFLYQWHVPDCHSCVHSSLRCTLIN